MIKNIKYYIKLSKYYVILISKKSFYRKLIQISIFIILILIIVNIIFYNNRLHTLNDNELKKNKSKINLYKFYQKFSKFIINISLTSFDMLLLSFFFNTIFSKKQQKNIIFCLFKNILFLIGILYINNIKQIFNKNMTIHMHIKKHIIIFLISFLYNKNYFIIIKKFEILFNFIIQKIIDFICNFLEKIYIIEFIYFINDFITYNRNLEKNTIITLSLGIIYLFIIIISENKHKNKKNHKKKETINIFRNYILVQLIFNFLSLIHFINEDNFEIIIVKFLIILFLKF